MRRNVATERAQPPARTFTRLTQARGRALRARGGRRRVWRARRAGRPRGGRAAAGGERPGRAQAAGARVPSEAGLADCRIGVVGFAKRVCTRTTCVSFQACMQDLENGARTPRPKGRGAAGGGTAPALEQGGRCAHRCSFRRWGRQQTVWWCQQGTQSRPASGSIRCRRARRCRRRRGNR